MVVSLAQSYFLLYIYDMCCQTQKTDATRNVLQKPVNGHARRYANRSYYPTDWSSSTWCLWSECLRSINFLWTASICIWSAQLCCTPSCLWPTSLRLGIGSASSCLRVLNKIRLPNLSASIIYTRILYQIISIFLNIWARIFKYIYANLIPSHSSF